MRTTTLTPVPAPNARTVVAELHEQLEDRVFAPMRLTDTPTTPAVVTERPFPSQVRRTSHGTWAVAASFDQDPVAKQEGGIIRAPKSERQRLAALHQAGLRPDLVFLLRELPGTWQPGTPPPHMVGIEAARSAHEQQHQVAMAAIHFGVALVQVLDAAAQGLARGAAVVGRAAGTAVAGAAALIALDPVVLVGIEHPSGPVAWVPVAAWDEVDGGRRR